TSRKGDVSSLKDTFLECPVCVEHFNQTDRRPRLLHSCLHAFCTQCLQQLLDKEGNGEITCPLCRRIEKVSGTAQMIAIDPVRDQLVEYLHIQKKKQVLCKDCPDGNHARSRCFECGGNLCLDCENAHRRNRSTRGHEIKLLGELQAASCESLKVRTFCCNHQDHFIECFCSTCEALCCVMCAIIDHKGHEFQKLDDAAATIIKKIEGSMNEVQDIFKSLSNAKSESGEYVTVVQRDKERSISEINQKFDAISKRLKHRKETLMGSIEDQSERLIAAANTNGAAFDEGLAEIESTMTYFSNVKTKADNVNILQIQSSLRKKIDHLTHRYGGKEIPKNTERCHFEAQHEENIHQGIDAFGVVRSRGAEGLRMTEPERSAVKKKALGVACKANNHIIQEDTLKLWSLDEINDLKKIEQECGVSITANKTLGSINLHGLKHNLSNANGKVYEMIRELDELQRVVQWSFVELTEDGEDKVVDYDKKVNVMLERAYTKQQKTKLVYEGYTYDFTKWVEYPTEDACDTVTMIRRDKVSGELLLGYCFCHKVHKALLYGFVTCTCDLF
ncbi:E3 ubiquitin-protein ligase TRIM56-like, partial [Haliotis rufescens]|uniref:E3 ubiquitin-protein ligase TRIM56-like n=1 Tax=Haliotis rufescens TaxID=6454 RepID=UPI00201EF4AD